MSAVSAAFHADARTTLDAVVILAVSGKKPRATPQQVIDAAKKRLKSYQSLAE